MNELSKYLLPLITLGSLFLHSTDISAQNTNSTPDSKSILLSFQQPQMGTLFTIRLWTSPADSENAKIAADEARAA